MKVQLNGEWRELIAPNLAAALEECGLAGTVLATAVNGEFVPVGARRMTPLTDGDRLEALSPMQGG